MHADLPGGLYISTVSDMPCMVYSIINYDTWYVVTEGYIYRPLKISNEPMS